MTPNLSEAHVSLQSLARLAHLSIAKGVSIDALIGTLWASYEAKATGEPFTVPAEASPRAGKTGGEASPNYRYRIEVLGKIVTANSLGTLCAHLVDAVHNKHPAILEALSKQGTIKRALLSRTKNGVHLFRPDLPVVQADSGWWVSANVSKPQTMRWIETLCEIAGWQLGQQIRLVQI
jgi:hypothetical protein